MFPIRDSIPTKRFPIVNVSLMALNVLVFLFQISLTDAELEAFIFTYGVVPERFADAGLGGIGLYFPILSSMFMHGGWLHLIGNVWTLYIFGDNVEDRMGRGQYLAFYLLCGLLATGTHLFFNWGSPIPVIGASGAISGVMGAYLLLCPKSRITMLLPIFYIPFFFKIPSWVYLLYWLGLQLINGTSDWVGAETTGGVAYWAHIGGFAAGFILQYLFKSRKYEAPEAYQTYKYDPRTYKRGKWEGWE